MLSCRLTSKVWCAAVDEGRTESITLHVEDRDHFQTWRFPEKYHLKGKDFKENNFPLWCISTLPDQIASRVTKMTLVVKFSAFHMHCYDLEDYQSLNGTTNIFWKRFTNLADLTLLSDFNMAATLFLRSDTGLNGFYYEQEFFTNTDKFPLSLKKLTYLETCTLEQHRYFCNDPCTCGLKTLVEAAPNLEILECPGNERLVGKMSDLLPLSKSLRRLNLHNCKYVTNGTGSSDAIIKQLLHLEAWNLSGLSIPERTTPLHFRVDLLAEEFRNETPQNCPLIGGEDWEYCNDNGWAWHTYCHILSKFIEAVRETNVRSVDRNTQQSNSGLWLHDPTSDWNTNEKWKDHIKTCGFIIRANLQKQQLMKVGDWSSVTYQQYRRETIRFQALWHKQHRFQNPFLTIDGWEVSNLARKMKLRRQRKTMKTNFFCLPTSLGLSTLKMAPSKNRQLEPLARNGFKKKRRQVYAPLELKVESRLIFGCPWRKEPLVTRQEHLMYRRPFRNRYLVAEVPSEA